MNGFLLSISSASKNTYIVYPVITNNKSIVILARQMQKERKQGFMQHDSSKK